MLPYAKLIQNGSDRTHCRWTSAIAGNPQQTCSGRERMAGSEAMDRACPPPYGDAVVVVVLTVTLGSAVPPRRPASAHGGNPERVTLL
ncbi:unnamed protein product [Gadus morhua 'NCC']